MIDSTQATTKGGCKNIAVNMNIEEVTVILS